MALITQKQQWYLVSTDRSNDTIQILADRLAGTNRSVNLLDTYFSWNTSTQNYDRLSVSAAATLVINKAYWIYYSDKEIIQINKHALFILGDVNYYGQDLNINRKVANNTKDFLVKNREFTENNIVICDKFNQVKNEINNLKKNAFVIDMTTGEPEVTRKISNILAKKNVNFIDAPVSGGPKGAREGIIAIMAGCEEIIFQKVKPLLNMISTNVFHAGPTGSGHSLKAGNNLLNLICRIATFEVVSMLVKDGIDPKKAVEVIQKSSGRNYATEITLPDNILSGKMFQGFTTGLMNKDASIALKNGALLNVGLPLGDLSKKILQETINDFGLDADMSNIALNFEEKNQIKLSPLTE